MSSGPGRDRRRRHGRADQRLPHPGRRADAALGRHRAASIRTWRSTTWRSPAPASASRSAAPPAPSLRANAIHDCLAEGRADLRAHPRPGSRTTRFQRNKGAGLAARDGARPALRRQRVRQERASELPPEHARWTRCASTILPVWTRQRRADRQARRQEGNDRPRRPQARQVRNPPQAGPRRHGRRLPGAGHRAGTTRRAEADRARAPTPIRAMPSKPSAAAPNCRRSLAAIDPRVVRVYDSGDLDGFFFVAMEYIDGQDLAELMRRGPLDVGVRRRRGHRRGRDAGERPQPASRPSTARSFTASSTATSSRRTSASTRTAKCACSISASPRRSRFRAG